MSKPKVTIDWEQLLAKYHVEMPEAMYPKLKRELSRIMEEAALESAHKQTTINLDSYQEVGCTNCGATYSITFKNKTAHIGYYAMAIDQKLCGPCPECGETTLETLDEDKKIR